MLCNDTHSGNWEIGKVLWLIPYRIQQPSGLLARLKSRVKIGPELLFQRWHLKGGKSNKRFFWYFHSQHRFWLGHILSLMIVSSLWNLHTSIEWIILVHFKNRTGSWSSRFWSEIYLNENMLNIYGHILVMLNRRK